MNPSASVVADLIAVECDGIKAMLLAKNQRYGSSAFEPLRIFSAADATEQIKVRIDDKLSRIARGSGAEDEDVVADLIGYLVILRVAKKLQPQLPPTVAPDSQVAKHVHQGG